MPDIGRARRLPDRVHGQLRQADIDCADVRGEDGPDCRPARSVVADFELLQWDICVFRHAAGEEGGLRVRGVALLGVSLDDYAAVELGGVVGLGFVGVIWVDL